MSKIYRAGSNSCHVLEFEVFDETSCFGINVLKVGQVMNRFGLQAAPSGGPLFEGIHFWRGKSVPVLDLRRLFGADQRGSHPQLLILQILNHEVGILVDRAKEVHYIAWNDVVAATEPRNGPGGGKYLTGVAGLSDGRRLPLFDFELLVMEHIIGMEGRIVDGPEKTVSLGGLRVLYAEDSATVRSRVARKLIAHGADVISVQDGKEALSVLEKDEDCGIKLVVTDVEMPRMDGFRLLKEIQKAFPGKYRTMIYTSLSHAGLSRQAEEVGANRVMTKYDDTLLIQNIAELLHLKAA